MPSIVRLAGAEKDTFDVFKRLELRESGASELHRNRDDKRRGFREC